MGRAMLFRQPKTRRFHYYPLFYREERHTEEPGERRIHFRRSYRLRKKRKSYIGLILLLILVIFFLEYLNRYRVEQPKQIELKNLEIVK